MIQELFTQDEILVGAGESYEALYVVRDAVDAVLTQRIVLEKEAQANLTIVLFDSVEISLLGELRGDRSAFECSVVYVGSGAQQMKLAVNSEHIGKDTSAHMTIRGAALEKSLMDFQGSINITRSGNGTNGHLEHEGLLLSKNARINALPGFTIDTDNVQAVHSSAVHYIRPEQLFYMQARGIEEKVGRQMIVRGFLEEPLAVIEDESVSTEITALLEEKMNILHTA